MRITTTALSKLRTSYQPKTGFIKTNWLCWCSTIMINRVRLGTTFEYQGNKRIRVSELEHTWKLSTVFQYSEFVHVDDNTCTEIVDAFPSLINLQGANLSNEHYNGGKWEVISYLGHFKLLLSTLLKDFSQLPLLNLQVLGKLWFFSLPILMALESRNVNSDVLCIHIHVSSRKSEGKLSDETWQYQIFLWYFVLPDFQTANSRCNFSSQNHSCFLGLSTQDGIYFTHIWQAWWILESIFCITNSFMLPPHKTVLPVLLVLC